MNPSHWNNALTRLALMAALAPSSHNCQPWRLVGVSSRRFEREMAPLETEDEDEESTVALATHSLLVCIDRQRTLRALPALEREMHMSVGGFASLLMNLLRLSGFSVAVQWLPPRWQAMKAIGRERLRDAEAVLALHLSGPVGGPPNLLHPLEQWIAKRTTVRGPFVAEAATGQGSGVQPATCLPHRLGACGRWQAVPPGPPLNRLAAFYREHAVEDFRHHQAWSETYAHLHFGGAQRAAAQGQGLGIPIEALFGPLSAWRRRVLQSALHPRLLPLLGPLGGHARLGRDFEHLVQHSAGVWLLVQDDRTHAAHDERRNHLLAGEAVIDSWLASTRDGLAWHPLSVALQHAAVAAALGRLLELDAPVMFIARVGQPTNHPAWPRLRRAASSFCQFDFSRPSTTAPFAAPAQPC